MPTMGRAIKHIYWLLDEDRIE